MRHLNFAGGRGGACMGAARARVPDLRGEEFEEAIRRARPRRGDEG
jgi:hypothetical protein